MHLGKVDFASKRKTVTVEVPELEGSFILRALSLAQLDSLKEGEANNTAKLLAMAIVDEQGQRLYTTEEDIANLSEMSVSVMQLLSNAATTLNGISKEAVEEASKKSKAGQNSASDSVSPAT